MKKIHIILVLLFAFVALICTNGVASAYLSTEYVGNTMVDLSWDEYENTDFSKYELCRDGVPIKTTTDRTYTFYRDKGLTKGKTYNYWLRVYNATGVLKRTRTRRATTGEVHGTITLDTAWTAANSPYTLTEGVDVRNGATLTITSGIVTNTTNTSSLYWSPYMPITVMEKGALYADGVSFSGVAINIYDDSDADIKNCFFELIGYVNVHNGSTLTIRGGIVTNVSSCDDYQYIVVMEKGALYADGVSFSGVNIVIDDDSHADIKKCFVEKASIFLISSNNNVITGNTLSNSYYIALSLVNSSNNVIAGNTFLNANAAISLDISNKNDIIDNNASSNDFGVFLVNSSNNVITGNTLSNNRWDGIFLRNSSNNVIKSNTVSNNNDTGIDLYNSSANTIYNNYFNNTINALDDGNNTWNITKTAGTNIVGGPYLGGNYWSDYNGTDLDGDELGDTLLPYNCSGGIENGDDWHPLIEIEKIILKASKDGYASVQHEVDNDENFGQIEISGNVTDELTTEPIEGAKVEIVKGANHTNTTTDADGTYSITVIIPDGSGSDTREDVYFELPPSQYIVGVYEITSEVFDLIEENNGTILDQCQYEDGPQALLVNISKEEDIDDFITNVESSSLVKYVELNRIVYACYIPNDPLYQRQWNLWNISTGIKAGSPPNLPPTPSAWDVEKGDKNVIIAIVDTGIQYNHEDLNYSNDGTIKYVYGYDWVDMDDDPLSLEAHGTQCTGIATAVMDNGIGIAGIAPNCRFISERVMRIVPPFGLPRGLTWNISRGIMDAADPEVGDPDAAVHGADVISMSFGSPVPSKFGRNATLYASSLGCILVAAAGNFADEGIHYPAAYPWVIAVGATNQQNFRAPFSNWGPELELVAPGVAIMTTVPLDDYGPLTGTCAATSHVAGVAALVKSRAERWPLEPLATDPWYHLNNNQIRQVLVQSAVDLGSPSWDKEYGYGRIDAGRAVRCVNISGNVLEAVLNAPIPGVEVRVTSIEGPPGVYTTNENTALARITHDGEYYIRVPPGVYSICAMAQGYIPSRGLGGERMELPAFDLNGHLYKEYREFRLLPLPCNVSGTVTDRITGLPINKANVSLDGPPHIYPPHPNVKIKTETNASGKYRFILTYGVHPGGLYDITVNKSGYQNKTQNFTLNWDNVITDYYKCRLSPLDYNPPIVNFSLLPVPSKLPSVPSELPDLTLTSNDIRVIFNENATVSATVHNIGTADASNIIVQFFDGDPNAGGVQIGSDQIISRIPAGGVGTAQVTWIAIHGTHDIFVRVDPYDSIQEASENNNQAHKPITIEPTYDQPPIASFIYSPLNPVANDTITFNASNSYDSDGFIVNYEWGFGDELNKTGEAVTHAYASPGNYNVILTVTDNDGAVDTETKGITVSGVKTIYVDDDFTDDPANHRWDTIQEGITDANDGDTVLVYNGTYTENVVLNKTITLTGEGMPKIDAQSLGDAINITADNCTVKGFSCVNAQPSPYAGIHVESGNNVIEENTCKDNYMGIYLSGSLNKIRNNIANYNHADGIGLGTSSDNNTIVNNTAKNNGNNGIHLKESNNNKIANNIANSNKFDGIRLRSNSNNIVTNNMANSNNEAGILCLTSSDNILTYNNLSSNSFGIWLHNYSTENIVANNTANSNYYYAIHVRWSSNNNIYLNNFIANIYNAYSYNSSNIWHSKSKITYTYNSQSHTNFMGNYWSDYKGSDTDGDGIGEDPYSIDGDKDYYPLMERFENLA